MPCTSRSRARRRARCHASPAAWSWRSAHLRAFDAADGEPDAAGTVPEGVTREDLVAIAAELVWFYVVQRDVMGWHRHEDALRFYGVPAEVLARMGPRRRG